MWSIHCDICNVFLMLVILTTTEAQAADWSDPINYTWQHQCDGNCSLTDHVTGRFEVQVNDVKTNFKVSLSGHNLNISCENKSGKRFMFQTINKYTGKWTPSNGFSLINNEDSEDALITLEKGTYYFVVSF